MQRRNDYITVALMSLTATLLYFASVLLFALGWEAICFCIAFRKWAHELAAHSKFFRISRPISIFFLALSALFAALLFIITPYPNLFLQLAWIPLEAIALYALWKFARAFLSHNKDISFLFWTILLTASYLILFVYIFYTHHN